MLKSRRLLALLPAAAGLLMLIAGLLNAAKPEADTLIAIWKSIAYCSAGLAISFLLLKKTLKPQTVFLTLSCFFGLFYIFIITPMSAPDETAHLQAVMTLSSQWLRGDTICDAAYLSADALTGHLNTFEAFTALTNGLFTETLTGNMTTFVPYDFTYTLMYLPQVIGSVLAQLLGLNRMWLYVLCDLCNWLFYTAMVYTAIRLMPRGNLPMALVASVPMALQLSTSLSPDPFIIAFAFMVTALLIRMIEGSGPIRPAELAALFFCGMMLSPAKAVYWFMLFPVLLVPSQRFGSCRKKTIFCTALLVCTFAFTVLFQLGPLLKSAPAQPDGTYNYYTVSWVLSHLPQTIVMIIKTLFPSGIWFYLESAMGTQLSGLSLNMVNGYLYAMLFILLLSALCSREGETCVPVSRRLIFISLCCLSALGMMGVMLLNWTVVGEIFIQGVQGRYFLPLAAMILYCLRSRTFIVTRDPTRIFAVAYAVLELLCVNHILGNFA